MDGVPVWLASVSTRNSKGIVATGDYTPEMMAECQAILEKLLDGVGDPARKRCFRMNITVCLHKAALESEYSQCRADWQKRDGQGIAGGNVEILWETVPGSDSTKPCVAPGKMQVVPGRRDLWVPTDCGTCAPCIARAAC